MGLKTILNHLSSMHDVQDMKALMFVYLNQKFKSKVVILICLWCLEWY